MRSRVLIAQVLLAVFTTPLFAAPLSVTPSDRLKDGGWSKRHEEKLAAPNRATAQVVFIGDSITQGWEGAGKSVWAHYYSARGALNLGYGGDRTENVLWRFDHGELDGLKAKVAVLMIGTNNTGHRKDSPEDIAAGVRKILDVLQQKLPKTKILVLAIFPRSAAATDAPRVNNDKADKLIAGFADNKRVFFLDINNKFLQPDGTLSKDIMPDLLHPKGKGYEIWAEAMEPELSKMLGDRPVKPVDLSAKADKAPAKPGKAKK